jgi:hypothetical protein
VLRRRGSGCCRCSIDCVDRFRPPTAQLQEILLVLPPLAGPFLALLFDLTLQTLSFAPAFLKESGPFLPKAHNLVVHHSRLLRESIVLEPLSLTLIENGEKSNGRHAGHMGFGIFADDYAIDAGHVGDGDMRRLADLEIFDHGTIDADSGPAHVLESVAVVAHIHNLAHLDATSTGPLNFLAANSAVGNDVGGCVEHRADLTDRQNVSPKIRFGKIAVVDEDPTLDHRRNEAPRRADRVALTVGSNRGPTGPTSAVAPGHPSWRPGISRNPEPAKVRLVIPATVMINRPGEGFRGLPVPTVIVGPDPTAFLIRTPAPTLPSGQPDIGKVRVSHPGTITPKFIIENVDPSTDSRADGPRRCSRCQRGRGQQSPIRLGCNWRRWRGRSDVLGRRVADGKATG